MDRMVFTLMAALTVAACGTDSSGTNGSSDHPMADAGSGIPSDAGSTVPRCGDHVCTAASETCATCAADCGCASGNSCTGAGTTATCTPTNPLIATLPGTWERISVNDRPITPPDVYEMTVDSTDPTCEYHGQPQGDPGDACVHGFSPVGGFILSGDRLHVRSPDTLYHADGQVLEEGRRVEFDFTSEYNHITTHNVYVKQ